MSRWYAEDLFYSLYPDARPAGARAPAGPPAPGPAGLSRRGFLRIGAAAGGGLLVAMSLPGCGKKERARELPAAPDLSSREPFEANAFVRIDPDSTATVTISKSEMGQGVRTTLALIVAEELDLDWSRVRVVQAGNDPDTYGSQTTGGSASIRTLWPRLRQAGATARAMLVAAGAQSLGVDAASLVTEDSHVVHPITGRKLAYGDLADLAARQSVPAQVTLKDPAQFRLLGKERAGIDVDDIVQGKAVYGMDVRLDGMLYASVERAPVIGGRVASFQADQALAVPGVVQVVEIEPVTAGGAHVRSGVAVIARNTWAALQGRKALAIQWSPGPHAKESSDGYRAAMDRATATRGKERINTLGDPDAVLGKARDVVRARYELPFLAHATMEPMNFTARVEGDRCHLMGSIQNPDWAVRATAEVLGIPKEKVTIEITLLGGGFGRRLNVDYAVEAALVARQVDAPVQVIWTREDDLRNDFYRPAAVHLLEASLDADGYPEAWRHRMSTPAIRVTYQPDAPDPGVAESHGASDMLYRVPNRSCEYTLLPAGVPRGWWRAVHTTHTTFAVESFLDELAEKTGKDPYAYRLHLIDALAVDRPEPNKDFPPDPARLKGVLTLAAEKAGWGTPLPAGHGRGIACVIDHLSYCAQVIEVSVEGGKLRVHRVVCAADCGPVLNPSGARAQLEGGIVQALSVALHEKITLRDGRVEQSNFDTYPILRIGDCPVVIETHFVDSDAHPTGLGEPSVPPVAPALASAVYQATGKRPRTLPITL